MTHKELKEKYLNNPEVKAEYDALEPEYQLIKAIIRERENQSLSQQALADLTGINRADISRLENGGGNPSLKTMKRLAKGLGKKLKIELVS